MTTPTKTSVEMPAQAMTEAARLQQLITEYLANGGLFNPELANHDSVRDLLIGCRDTLAALASQPAGAGEWISVEQQRPNPGVFVLVASSGWEKPKVLKFESRRLKDNLWERLIDNDTGRWYWYPERMHWMPLPGIPARGQQEGGE